MRASFWFLLCCSGCSAGLSNFNTLPPSGLDADADADPDTDSDTADDSDQDGPNTAPTVDAGDDASGTAGQIISLHATAQDAQNDELFFDWELTESPAGWAGSLLNANRDRAELHADVPGLYVAEVAVTDGEFTTTDDLTVFVEEPNNTPVANAGADLYGEVGVRVYLDGTGSLDPEGDAFNYEWSLVDSPVNSSAGLSGFSVAQPHLTPDYAGVYVIELVVVDSSGNASSPDTVRVVAESADDAGDGGGGLFGCLNCAAANERISAGDAAAAPFLLSLPLLFVLFRRRD